MRTTALILTAGLSAATLAATAGPADACSCRVRHHAVYRHTSYYGRTYYRPYSYAYGYRTPAYYSSYGYDPYVYRSYYDWSYEPGVWVGYGSPGYYGYGYGGGWRRHHEWRSYSTAYGYGRGHWHEGGHGHWDHGRHHGEG
jgi:hypothetical protein